MSKIERLLEEYGSSHQNAANKKIHWICVPAILLSLVGLLWTVPVPSFFENFHVGPLGFNWAVLLIITALIYYFILSVSLALGMIIVIILLTTVGYLLAAYIPLPLWATCVVLFVLSWTGQFIGHGIEGKKPSFFKDIQFLLIGPVWLLSFIYKKLGIPLTQNVS